MNEVKYFKDLGLRLVVGDIDQTCRPISSRGVTEFNSGRHGHFYIKEFAWRTNTGEKPSYTGDEIEVEFRYGEVARVLNDENLDWELLEYRKMCSDIIKWRPTLQSNKNTVEDVVKSVVDSDLVYTQEMANNNIYPKAGMWFLGRDCEHDKFVKVEALFDNEDVVYVREEDKVAHYHFSKSNPDCQFKPIKTDEQILREELVNSLGVDMHLSPEDMAGKLLSKFTITLNKG